MAKVLEAFLGFLTPKVGSHDLQFNPQMFVEISQLMQQAAMEQHGAAHILTQDSERSAFWLHSSVIKKVSRVLETKHPFLLPGNENKCLKQYSSVSNMLHNFKIEQETFGEKKRSNHKWHHLSSSYLILMHLGKNKNTRNTGTRHTSLPFPTFNKSRALVLRFPSSPRCIQSAESTWISASGTHNITQCDKFTAQETLMPTAEGRYDLGFEKFVLDQF